MSKTHVDSAIEAYRRDLVAEAELAESDLDEIEDHLRALTSDLRVAGMPATEAVAEAARRLGEPALVAREHARVRSAFGARLSRARAWSAALMVVPAAVYNIYVFAPLLGMWSVQMLESLLGIVIAAALLARLSWARPIALGYLAFFAIPHVVGRISFGEGGGWLVWHAGLLAFLLPWRRGELSRAGWALALHVAAYSAASLALGFYVTAPNNIAQFLVPAAFALGFAAAATCGCILRARWAALASLASSVMLVSTIVDLWDLRFRFAYATLMRVEVLSMLSLGALAAVVAAVLSWRTARSTLGTWQHVLR